MTPNTLTCSAAQRERGVEPGAELAQGIEGCTWPISGREAALCDR